MITLWAVAIAQSAPDPGTAWLIGQGALGLGCLVMAGVIRVLWRDNVAAHERERETTIHVYGTVLPTLTRTTEVVAGLTTALQELTRELRG